MSIVNLRELADNLNRAIDLFKVANDLPNKDFFDVLGRSLDCDFGNFWLVENELRLVLKLHWFRADTQGAQKLQTEISMKTLSISEGMPGHVWKSKKIFWSNDLIKHMSLPRSILATKAGFNFGIWIPILDGTSVYGVIELLGKSHQSLDADAVAMIDKFSRSFLKN